jgi:hypothetical protein
MEYVTLKVSELSGAALDWAVAKCEGRQEPEVVNNFAVAWYTWPNTHYSTDWAQGGPIIEREGISIRYSEKDARGAWYAVLGPNRFLSPDHEGSGPTPLIAAMRCYVASKLGDDVDVPLPLIG